MAATTGMTGAAYDQPSREESRNLELIEGEVISVSSPIPEHRLIALTLGTPLLVRLRGHSEQTRYGEGPVITPLLPGWQISLHEIFAS